MSLIIPALLPLDSLLLAVMGCSEVCLQFAMSPITAIWIKRKVTYNTFEKIN